MEEFKPYFENMSNEQMAWTIKEEEYCRKKFNYACKTNLTIDSLKENENKRRNNDLKP